VATVALLVGATIDVATGSSAGAAVAGGGALSVFAGIGTPAGITVGSDGAIWFASPDQQALGRVTVDGTLTMRWLSGASGVPPV
jgi:hypothetical protein